MLDHTDNTLRAVIRSLETVVGPALDPTDPLASEQLTLVVDALRLLRERVDDLHARHRFEVAEQVALARDLGAVAADTASGSVADRLRAGVEHGAAALDRAATTTAELRALASGLAAASRDLVRESADFDPDVRHDVERCVLASSERQTAVDRAWHLPQGFDPEPDAVRPLSEVLPVSAPAGR